MTRGAAVLVARRHLPFAGVGRGQHHGHALIAREDIGKRIGGPVLVHVRLELHAAVLDKADGSVAFLGEHPALSALLEEIRGE